MNSEELNLCLSFINNIVGVIVLIVSFVVMYWGYWVPRTDRQNHLEKQRLERLLLATQMGEDLIEVSPTPDINMGHL